MKNLLNAGSLVALLLLGSCQGPVGPQGIPGPEGLPGPQGSAGAPVVSTVFEIDGSFTVANEYRLYFDFPPEKVEVLESDVVLVYRLWETVQEGTQRIPVWRLLPQTVFLPQGLMQYNFDHTFLDVSIFVDAQFGLSTLATQWTQNQTFRVVIIPADFGRNLRHAAPDLSDYEAVREYYGLREEQVHKYRFRVLRSGGI
jgi:hypothetical protein